VGAGEATSFAGLLELLVACGMDLVGAAEEHIGWGEPPLFTTAS